VSIPELIAALLAFGALAYVLAPLMPGRGAVHRSPAHDGTCPACGAPSPRGARFCANCGRPLAASAE
jgi:predicted amidophosphoribosyltransferase